MYNNNDRKTENVYENLDAYSSPYEKSSYENRYAGFKGKHYMSPEVSETRAASCRNFMIAGLTAVLLSKFIGLAGIASLVLVIIGTIKVKKFFTDLGEEKFRKLAFRAQVGYGAYILACILIITKVRAFHKPGVSFEQSMHMAAQGSGMMVLVILCFIAIAICAYLFYVWCVLFGEVKRYCGSRM